MKRTAPATPLVQAPSFIEALIGALWRDRHALIAGEQENYEDLRSAVYALRQMCGLSQEQMAARLGMMTNKLALIEKRGGPIDMQDFKRMQALAWEFSLFKMYIYMERQALLQRGKMKKKRPLHAT